MFWCPALFPPTSPAATRSIYVFFIRAPPPSPPLFSTRSLNVGMQRPGLASVPTLLLALGLALAATPTAGDLRAGWGGLRTSLAANLLLAIRAIAAKVRKGFLFSAVASHRGQHEEEEEEEEE